MPDKDEAQRLVERLPDTYAKKPGSKVVRFFQIMAGELNAIKDALTTTERYRDVDQATGRTLDRIGSNVRQPRGQLADETYRALIKTKITRNLSRGDVDSVKRIIASMLSIDPSGVELQMGWRDDPPEPAAVTLLSAPLDAIARFGLGPEEFAVIAQRIVAAGVRVGTLLQGTFEFDDLPKLKVLAADLEPFQAAHDPVLVGDSIVDDGWVVDGEAEFDEDSGLEYFLHVLLGIDIYIYEYGDLDPDKGFADEAQTIGGTLGAYYDAPSPELPID